MTADEEPDPPGDTASAHSSARSDVLAGATFVAIGLAFAVGAFRYELGTLLQMGPGYYPLVLGGLLAALGVGVAAQGLLHRRRPRPAPVPAPTPDGVHGDDPSGDDPSGDDAGRGPVPWASMALVVAAIAVFALGVRGLGLVPALLVALFLAAFAGYRRAVPAALAAGGITALCVLIFVVALQLRLPLVGSLFTG